MDSETRAFLRIMQNSEKLVMKIGIITAFTTPTVSVKLGGDIVNAAGTVITTAPVITGVHRLASYTTPVANDVVLILADEKKQLFTCLGRIL
jgi:hypothetical protein